MPLRIYSRIIIFFALFLIGINIYPQYVKDDTIFSYDYYVLGQLEFINIWTIADYNKPTSISDIYIDKKRRLHFAYYDTSIKKPVYITGKGSSFKKQIIDDKTFRGQSISLTVDPISFNVHVAYIDEDEGSLQYANNLNFQFNNYPADILKNSAFNSIDLVVSPFREPVIFFLDKNKHAYLSRFYNNVFFTDAVYTNKPLQKIKAFANEDGYSLFLEEADNGNIFYATRETNTQFRFYDNKPIIKNALSYQVYFYDGTDFIIAYIEKDSPNIIREFKFLNRKITDEAIIQSDKNISTFAMDYRLNNGISILFQTDDGFLNFYENNGIIDLSILQKTEGAIVLKYIDDKLYTFIYHNALTKEIKLALINMADIRKYTN